MKKISGLTLIEVLIALAIISIALTAVIKAASQNIRATTHLEDKTVAMWVATQVLNEVRVGVIKLPDTGDKFKQPTSMLGRDWYSQIDQEETPNKRIKKIMVNVFHNENDDENTVSPVVTLESFIYHEE